MKTKMTSKERLPLIGMTVSAFIFNTSEFMPIGLLTDIAKSFSISEAKAGMLITVYSDRYVAFPAAHAAREQD